jgi:hypothetical protein
LILTSAFRVKKVILFTACAIDGFIASPDGSLDWSDAIPNPEKTDHGYRELLADTSDPSLPGHSKGNELEFHRMHWLFNRYSQSYI